MTRDDMMPWMSFGYGGPSPYQHEWVEIEQPDWPGPRIVRPRDLHPMMNVARLQWRPVDQGAAS